MRLLIRLLCCLVVCVLLVSVFSSYYEVQREKNTLRRDLEKRSEMLAESLQPTVENLIEGDNTTRLKRTVERFGNREHLIGIAVYGPEGQTPIAMTSSLSGRISDAPEVLRKLEGREGRGEFGRLGKQRVHYYAMPLQGENGGAGTLVVFTDSEYIRSTTAQAWREMSVRVMVQMCMIVMITALIFHRNVMKPIARTTAWMRDLRHGKEIVGGHLEASEIFGALTREATHFADSLVAARASAEEEARLRDTAESSWTAERLAVSLRQKLNGSRLFVVANREPYMHKRKGKTVEVQVPASGLVTALEPILRACDGTWVAHGSADADLQTVDERDCLRVPPEDPRYTLRRVWLGKEEEEGYYFGFSNEGLWPLCHMAHTRPTFRATDWEQYQKVNAKFADAVLSEMKGAEQPVVIVQDYHFALVPKMIKEKRPDARVGIFWHIPWPNPEAFGICPWQRELLDGLLGADLIGFHVQFHCDNFLETVNRALEARVEWDRFGVSRGNHFTSVRPFPISVVFPEERKEEKKSAHVVQAALLGELGTDALYMGVGVDRVDYTKGIVERFLGVERFLEKYPHYQGKFTFVQIGAPSRTRIKRYHDFLDEVDGEAARINARFQTNRWQPILFRKRHHTHAEVERFYRAADVCMVTSLHDGMNLVAKEYLATRHDEDGMLVLSQFTGAARELTDALIVNPYDTESLADAIYSSLEMHPRERRARMHRMRNIVRKQNVYRWAGDLIGDLSAIRVSASVAAERDEVERKHPMSVEREVPGVIAAQDGYGMGSAMGAFAG